jgi:predicted lipoprotein with Yx(FWY)xxD motif
MRHLLKLFLPAVATALLVTACGSSSSSNTTSSAASAQPAAQTSGGSPNAIVKTASNSTLGTILVDGQGITLYRLSGEQNGKFICTSSVCLSAWHPLTAPASGTPSGAVSSLGTVKRPGGTLQVTYKGAPLYTFTGDHQPGETKGEGIKDVGTWSAVTISSSASQPSTSSPSGAAPSTSSSPAESQSSGDESSSGGGYSY